jgi:predicted O-linked N-acetylglucosamine transferase (SPINDLY family)
MSNRDDAQSLQLAFSLHRSGKFAEAAKLYRKIIKRNPREPHALHSLGIIEAASGNAAEAARLMARSLSVQTTNVQFMQNYATVLCQLEQYEAARAVCLKGLEADGTNVYLLYVAAGALFKQGRLQDALSQFDRLLLLEPNHIAAITERGSVLLELEQYDAAAAGIEKAITLDPGYAEAYVNRGALYARLKRHDEAIASLDKALRLNPNLANAWLGRGNVFFGLKRYDDAFSAYDRALSIAPGLAEAWLGRGNVFFDLKRCDDALAAYDKALSIRTDLAEAWLGRGNTFFDLKRYDEALVVYDKALSFKPLSAEAWAGRGNVFAALKRYEDAVAGYDRALSLKPDLVALEGDRIHSKMNLCDWTDFEAECDHLVQSVRNGKANTSPFAFLGIGSSVEDQFNCARLWVQKRYPPRDQPPWRREPHKSGKIRVGYVSTDFRQHPVANLAVGVFECHDRSQFEVLGVSIGPNDNSEIRRRLERAFDKFVDAAALGTDDITRLIREQGIDILIDLSGFTWDARTEIFTRHPAPVQVNYLGYAGTMGAEYIDYLVADPILIPASHRECYMEKIAYLPHSYMPHDDASRLVSDRSFERAEFGLPENGFVFCCFNNAYKLNPTLFCERMKLLKAVEGSVLWLSENNATAVNNLRREAVAAGVDPDRLVFAGRLPSSADHLARHRLADLFLDTLPYNAHTTASDALWAGLPVLTQIGETFAGRVAASLLTAIGLPELIVQTPQQFESTAIELATRPEVLAAIKDKLAQNRLTTPLFDTRLHTRHIESAYMAMYQRYQNGLLPDHIYVLE